MKNTRQKQREATDEIQEGLELLFGSEDELNDDELEAELKEFGVESASLEKKAHEHLRRLADHHFASLEREVPRELNEALRQFRPPTEEQRKDEVKKTADLRVKGIVTAAKAKASDLMGSIATSVNTSPQYAFRNRTDLSESDLEILERGQEEVDRVSSKEPQGNGHE
jgi:hypothetical protein